MERVVLKYVPVECRFFFLDLAGFDGVEQATMNSSTFKSSALPLHVNITHTPPVITDDDEKVPASSADPGFIGSSTLLPKVFKTGSYGWNGNKRVTIEVDNPEGGDKEKLQVMITINATVLGSKKNKADRVDEDEEAGETAENGDSIDEAENTAEE